MTELLRIIAVKNKTGDLTNGVDAYYLLFSRDKLTFRHVSTTIRLAVAKH